MGNSNISVISVSYRLSFFHLVWCLPGSWYDKSLFTWNLDNVYMLQDSGSYLNILFPWLSLTPHWQGKGGGHLVTARWKQKSGFPTQPPLTPHEGCSLLEKVRVSAPQTVATYTMGRGGLITARQLWKAWHPTWPFLTPPWQRYYVTSIQPHEGASIGSPPWPLQA